MARRARKASKLAAAEHDRKRQENLLDSTAMGLDLAVEAASALQKDADRQGMAAFEMALSTIVGRLASIRHRISVRQHAMGRYIREAPSGSGSNGDIPF